MVQSRTSSVTPLIATCLVVSTNDTSFNGLRWYGCWVCWRSAPLRRRWSEGLARVSEQSDLPVSIGLENIEETLHQWIGWIGVVEPSLYAFYNYSYNISSLSSLIAHMNQFLSNLPIQCDKNIKTVLIQTL